VHAYAWARHEADPFDWATRFDSRVRSAFLAGEGAALLDHESRGKNARLSIPTPNHYLPLIVVLGARQREDATTFPVEGVDGGSISVLSMRLG
jgi:4,5-DOPA dioxygenase extradiol